MSTDINLKQLIVAVVNTLDAFQLQKGVFFMKNVLDAVNNDSSNEKLLEEMKQNLVHLNIKTELIDINNELRHYIWSVVENILRATVIDRKFVTRNVNKFIDGLQPFVRTNEQQVALDELISAKEDVLGIEMRHRTAYRKQKNCASTLIEDNGSNDELQMTRELQSDC
ncbi:unnamed protein product, partial [Didymodactylos carnosus]